MQHVFNEPDELSFDKVGVKGKIFPITEQTDDIQFVRIDTETGHQTKISQEVCTFSYYVLEGSGYFEIDDVKEDCGVGDLIVIPPKKAFIYKGKMKLLLVVTPPWREEQEKTL